MTRNREIKSMRRATPAHPIIAAMTAAVVMAAIAAVFSPSPARSDEAFSPAAQRGLVLMRIYCSQCHAIDKVSESPLKIAPPLRDLHRRYPVESLEESLAEGVITGHPTMPEFRFDPGQVADVIAFLKSLER